MSECAKFSGEIFVQNLNLPNQPYVSLGNATCSLTQSLAKDSVPNYASAAGGEACSDTQIESVELAVTTFSVKPDTLKLALAALMGTPTVTALTNQPINAFLGELIPAAELIDTTVAPVVTNVGGAVVYVPNVDYTVSTYGIRVVAGSSLATAVAAGSGTPKFVPLEIDYTPLARYNFEGLTNASNSYRIHVNVENRLQNSKKGRWLIHQITLSPATDITLIDREFSQFEITGTLTPDITITAPGLSQYFRYQSAV